MQGLLDFTPCDEHDYFRVFRWQVGRKLAGVIVAAVIVLSLAALLIMGLAAQTGDGRSYPVFSYDSFFLKFYKGKAGIRAEDGHLSYVGKVSRGKANGKGILYRTDGSILYEGGFAGNSYQGKGTLYRAGSVKEYEGEFKEGRKHGRGKLYGRNGAPVFEGTFESDAVVYAELAGRPTSEVSGQYTGRQTMYTRDDEMCVVMEDIHAVYTAQSGEDSLDGEWTTSGIYVMENAFTVGTSRLDTREQLDGYFKDPDYQGLTYVNLGDVVALMQDSEAGKSGNSVPEMEVSEGLKDVYEVSGFDPTFEVFISRYIDEEFCYTFFGDAGKEQRDTFDFYLIEPVGDNE